MEPRNEGSAALLLESATGKRLPRVCRRNCADHDYPLARRSALQSQRLGTLHLALAFAFANLGLAIDVSNEA